MAKNNNPTPATEKPKPSSAPFPEQTSNFKPEEYKTKRTQDNLSLKAARVLCDFAQATGLPRPTIIIGSQARFDEQEWLRLSGGDETTPVEIFLLSQKQRVEEGQMNTLAADVARVFADAASKTAATGVQRNISRSAAWDAWKVLARDYASFTPPNPAEYLDMAMVRNQNLGDQFTEFFAAAADRTLYHSEPKTD